MFVENSDGSVVVLGGHYYSQFGRKQGRLDMLTNSHQELNSHLSLTGRVYQIIYDRILNLELPPGTRLKDSELASALGVSNTPVREALRRLEAESLVETIPRRGTFVKQLSRQEIEGLYEVRVVLEKLSIRLASLRASDALLQQVTDTANLYTQAVKRGDTKEFLEYDRQFHDLIGKGAANPILASTLRSLADRIQIIRHLDLGKKRNEKAAEEHQEIAAALLQRDADRAVSRMESHILSPRNRVLDMLK